MMRTFLTIIILCSCFSIAAQDKAFLDSLNNELKDMECNNVELVDSLSTFILDIAIPKGYDKQIGDAYANLVRILRCKSEHLQAIDRSKKGIQHFRKIGDLEGEARILVTIGASYRKLHKIESALWCANRMNQIAEQLKDPILSARSFIEKSSVFIESHSHDSVLYYSLKALEIQDSLPERIEFTPVILTNLATAYHMEGDVKKAKELYTKAEIEYKKGYYTIGVPTALYINLNKCYIDMKEYDSAIYICEKGLREQKTSALKTKEKAYVVTSLNRGLARAYWAKSDVNKALKHGLIAKKVSKEANLNGVLVSALTNLIKYYSAAGNFNEAIHQGQEALQLTENTNLGMRKIILARIAKAYEKAGRLEEAIRSLNEHIKLEKQLQEEAKVKEFARLEKKYQNEKKEAEIQDLSQKATIQELEIAKRNQWLVIGGISILLILAISFGGYIRSQQQQSIAKAAKAELEQRFLRSQLNPHFVFNALDSIQNYMLDNDAPKAGLYMSKFAKLMRQVLENSRETFISLAEEVKMLENYMELQRLQATNDFTYTFHFDDEIEPDEFFIPPMFVQPFVENAIEHGIIQGKGEIDVHFELEQDLITIAVIDNGVGLSASQQVQTQKKQAHNSLATSIIKERIESYNEKLKTNIELLVSEVVDKQNTVLGTKVMLKVPYQES